MPESAPEAVGLSSARLGRIRILVRDYLTPRRAPGVLTMLARRDTLAFFDVQGAGSLESGSDLRRDTIFRIYSLTKPITCVALLMLVEAGKLALDDPVARFIPGFANLKVLALQSGGEQALIPLARPITIRHLLTHTAGLSYGFYNDTPVDDLYRARRLYSRALTLRISLADLAACASELPLVYQPGEGWRYSVAHDLLGYIIGLVSDRSFDEFLSDRIFAPLEMLDTGFVVPPAKQSRFASLYMPDASGSCILVDDPATSPFTRSDAPATGGGGLTSTADDYMRFARMLLNQGTLDGARLLQPATVALMTSNQLPESLLPLRIGPAWNWLGHGYGFGVAVLRDNEQAGVPGGIDSFEWAGAANTWCWIDPRNELIGLLMTQSLRGPDDPAIERRFRIMAYDALC